MLDNNTPCSPALDRNIPPSGRKCWRATAMTFDLAGSLEECGGGGGEQGGIACRCCFFVVKASAAQFFTSSCSPPSYNSWRWDLFLFFTSASSELSGVQSLVRLRRLKLDQRKLLRKEILQVTGSQAGHCVANGGRESASGWYFSLRHGEPLPRALLWKTIKTLVSVEVSCSHEADQFLFLH